MGDHLKAAGKIVKGAAQIVSGTATATGHGLIGSYCRSHHMMGAAARLGTNSVKKGVDSIKEGLEDWKRAERS